MTSDYCLRTFVLLSFVVSTAGLAKGDGLVEGDFGPTKRVFASNGSVSVSLTSRQLKEQNAFIMNVKRSDVGDSSTHLFCWVVLGVAGPIDDVVFPFVLRVDDERISLNHKIGFEQWEIEFFAEGRHAENTKKGWLRVNNCGRVYEIGSRSLFITSLDRNSLRVAHLRLETDEIDEILAKVAESREVLGHESKQ